MSSLLESLGQDIYENILGKGQTHVQIFTLLDAWEFFVECAKENKLVRYCLLSVKKSGDHYVVIQAMARKVNGKVKPIVVDGEYAMARQITAYNLDDDMIEYICKKDTKIMAIDTLKS